MSESYAAVVAGIRSAVRQRREDRGISLRVAAKEMGEPFSVLTRFEKGVDVRFSFVESVAKWLDKGSDGYVLVTREDLEKMHTRTLAAYELAYRLDRREEGAVP